MFLYHLDYKIIKENIRDNTYELELGITFDRKLVERFFQEKNISYSDLKKLNILVYPKASLILLIFTKQYFKGCMTCH